MAKLQQARTRRALGRYFAAFEEGVSASTAESRIGMLKAPIEALEVGHC